MAQPANYCNNFGTGLTTCANHRLSCSTNRVVTLSSEFKSTGKITAADIDALRVAIRDEIARYDLHNSYGPYTLKQGAAYGTLTAIGATQYNELSQMAFYVSGGTPFSKADTNTIAITEWTNLKSKYDTLRQDCICNSDCSCNNVCTCHNDCGCNYKGSYTVY